MQNLMVVYFQEEIEMIPTDSIKERKAAQFKSLNPHCRSLESILENVIKHNDDITQSVSVERHADKHTVVR